MVLRKSYLKFRVGAEVQRVRKRSLKNQETSPRYRRVTLPTGDSHNAPQCRALFQWNLKERCLFWFCFHPHLVAFSRLRAELSRKARSRAHLVHKHASFFCSLFFCVSRSLMIRILVRLFPKSRPPKFQINRRLTLVTPTKCRCSQSTETVNYWAPVPLQLQRCGSFRANSIRTWLMFTTYSYFTIHVRIRKR